MRQNTYFISDCHLGADYIANPRAHEGRVVAFLDSIKDDARALYLLGDILDYWYEYRNVVPRGHIRLFGRLAELADAGVQITWITGNHDVWLFDYLSREIPLRVVTSHTLETIGDTKFLLSHGDDVTPQPIKYRLMMRCFKSRFCQTLYAAVHPRWTYSIAHGWSRHNRVSRHPVTPHDGTWLQRQLEDFAATHHSEHPDVKFYVFGHLHIAGVTDVAPDARVAFLGDWLEKDTYAVYDGTTLEVRTFPSE